MLLICLMHQILFYVQNYVFFLARTKYNTKKLSCLFYLKHLHSYLINEKWAPSTYYFYYVSFRLDIPYARDMTTLLNRSPSWIEHPLKNVK